MNSRTGLLFSALNTHNSTGCTERENQSSVANNKSQDYSAR